MSTFMQGAPATETNSQQSTEQQTTENNKPFFQVGERVFKTPEELAKHIEHSQNHIKKLEDDFSAATTLVDKQDALLAKAQRVDELLEAYKQNSSGKVEGTTSLDKEAVIAEALRAFEQNQKTKTLQQQYDSNFKQVADVLVRHYGDRADEVVSKVAADNGLTIQEAQEMAKKHPKVLLKMFDLSNKTDARPTSGSVNTMAMPSTPAQGPRKRIMDMTNKERAAYIQSRLRELN